MPTNRVADDLMPGLLDDVPAQSREREANHSESSAAERRSERATPKGNRVGSTAGSQPDAEVSSQSGLVSEADQFHGTQCSESWSCSRLGQWPGRHAEHRAHNAGYLARRSLAAFGVCGCDRAIFDCLGSWQPAERNAAGACSIFSESGVECSGGQADESTVGRTPKSAVALRRPQAQRRGSLRRGKSAIADGITWLFGRFGRGRTGLLVSRQGSELSF